MTSINKLARPREWIRKSWPIVALIILTFATYANSLKGDFVWDDQLQVLRNVQIRDLRNLPDAFTSTALAFANKAVSNYYRPLQTVGYMVGYAIGGISPWPYHLLNVLLHITATILVYLLCRELYLSTFASNFAALIFAVHPIHTEVVDWIAALPDAGCGAAYVASLWAYLRYIRSSRRRWLGLSAFAFLVALLFKEMAITLPAVILALMIFHGRVFNRKLSAILLELTPYAAVTAAIVGIRLAMFGFIVTTHINVQATVWDWISLGVHVFGQYIRYSLLPYPLSAFHLIPVHFSDRAGATLLYGGLTVLVCAAVFAARNRIPALPMWLAVFALMLAPVFYFTGISVTFFAERYLYIPSFAAAIALALAIDRLSRLPKFILSGLLIILFTFTTVQRNKDWKEDLSLYNSTLRVYPEAVIFRINLGQIYFANNQDLQAKHHFEQALAHLQNSIYFHPPKEDARAYVNLAAIAGRSREFDQARRYLEKALLLDPESAPAHAYWGDMIMASERDYDSALPHLEKAIELDPLNDVAQDYIGLALFNLGRYEEASKHFQTALAINPTNKDAQEHLPLAKEKAYTNLALTAARSSKFDEAKRYLEMALAANPQNATAHAYLGGVIMESEQNYDIAMAHLRKAIELEPSNDVAHDYMGSALFNLGRHQEALGYFQRAVEINPANEEARQHLKIAKDKLKVP